MEVLSLVGTGEKLNSGCFVSDDLIVLVFRDMVYLRDASFYYFKFKARVGNFEKLAGDEKCEMSQ